ncbi:MAG TPA: TIGR00730 family Rossman fold protein [Acidobacteriota bacterium]|nr:TIGR00730 family Rossman fold protein [Acidobacteriota bacterium]
MKRICVFCGSNDGAKPVYAEAAKDLARTLARNNLGLVYGGGRVGLMGILADTVLEEHGEVAGIIPQGLFRKEVAHEGLTELRFVGSMHQRKAMMVELADGFIALPGGFGTTEEFCEVITWAQLGIHHKPCGVLNIEGYFNSFLAYLDHSVNEQFLRPEHRELVLEAETPEDLLAKMRAYHPPTLEKWMDLGET